MRSQQKSSEDRRKVRSISEAARPRQARIGEAGCVGIRGRMRTASSSRVWRRIAAPVIAAPENCKQAQAGSGDLGKLQVLGVVSVVEKIGCITDRILAKYGIGAGTAVFDLPEAA